MIAVILCGGSGTRLWPLSTPETPKQFLKLVSPNETMFQRTCLLAKECGASEIIVVMNRNLEDIAQEQIQELGTLVPTVKFILEPYGRNTAPAIAAATLVADENSTLLVMPSDHVWDTDRFVNASTRAVQLAETYDSIVTIGIVPTYAETGYGYIERSSDVWSHSVLSFREKPDFDTATQYLESGKYLWNSGVFVFGRNKMLRELEECVPRLVKNVRAALSTLPFLDTVSFSMVQNISIDYAVMEHTASAMVVPYTGSWSDVGSFQSLRDVLLKSSTKTSNYVRGNVRTLNTEGCLAIVPEESGIRVNLLGIKDLVVVVSSDGKEILITTPEQSQNVKKFC
jgi:mannose-1-phosphate guanylyltransferase/mannose-6-phosphate isomerase